MRKLLSVDTFYFGQDIRDDLLSCYKTVAKSEGFN